MLSSVKLMITDDLLVFFCWISLSPILGHRWQMRLANELAFEWPTVLFERLVQAETIRFCHQ